MAPRGQERAIGRSQTLTRRVLLACVLLLGTTLLASPVASAATFTVINNDGLGEGFNDPSPRAPVGGNTGTTLGAQRLIAFQYAANIWGGLLSSAVTIQVTATFDPLTCGPTSAVLGSAGPTTAVRDFSGALVSATWYPIALANALRGSDINSGIADINARFNSAIGTTCSFPRNWYYGLDGNAGGDIDFVTVLLHELGHGLGFTTLVDLASGAKALGLNDTFMLNLENHGASPADYPSMTNAQRVAASTSTGNLHWVGPHVRAASGVLSAGKVGDHVRMFAPSPQQAGSSVAHWDTALSPNQLLEPIYTVPMDPDLELALFQDIGWTLLSLSVSLTPNPASGPSPLSTMLSASIPGTGTGTINYTFWWNCAATGTSVSAVTATCGDPTNPAIGAKFNAVAGPSQNAPHVYSAGTFTAKVIAESGAAAAEARTPITVTAATAALQVTPPTHVAAAGGPGGPFSPPAFQYQLSTTGGSASFSISGVPSWLTASATTGTLTTSAATVTFTVNASANGLAPGTYGPATISFTNTTNGQGNTTRTATLTVNPAAAPPGTTPLYRFFNVTTGTHFYTISEAEKNSVIATLPQYHFESIAFYVFGSPAPQASPVYRFFNVATGTHFYTISEAEKNSVIATLPQFHFEGAAFYAYPGVVSGASPVYRFFNVATGTHFYTISEAEKNAVIATLPQYHFEGPAYFAYP